VHKRSIRLTSKPVYYSEETYERIAILSVFGMQAYQALFSERNERASDYLPGVSSDGGESESSLGLSEATNYRKPDRAPRGSRGITPTNRKAVRSVGTLLEFRYSKHRLSFATLTLPGLSESDRAIAQEEWCRVVQEFYQALKRYFAQRGQKFLYVGVTEIQPQRSEREGWAVPHLHFVFVGKFGKSWIITPSQLRKLWKRTWGDRFSSSYSWQSCENLVQVKKSVAGYLSKYLSKGSPLKSGKSGMALWFPSSWVSMNRAMKSWLNLTCVSVASIFPLLSNPSVSGTVFSRFGQKTVKATVAPGREIAVGVSGWIKASEWLDFLGAFYPEKLAINPENL
jgi:hypothetical protein